MVAVTRTTSFDELPEYLRVDECARFLDVGKGVVYDAVRRGTLPTTGA
jgi:hypothetical protein